MESNMNSIQLLTPNHSLEQRVNDYMRPFHTAACQEHLIGALHQLPRSATFPQEESSIREQVALRLLQEVIVMGAEEQEALDACLVACGPLESLSACASTLQEIASRNKPKKKLGKGQSSSVESPSILETALRTIRRWLVKGVSFAPDYSTSNSYEERCWVEKVTSSMSKSSPQTVISNDNNGRGSKDNTNPHSPMAQACLESLVKLVVMLPVQIANACHALSVQLPTWAISSRYNPRLVEGALSMALYQQGIQDSSFSASYFKLLIQHLVRNRNPDDAALGLYKYHERHYRSDDSNGTQRQPKALCHLLLQLHRNTLSPRESAYLLRSIMISSIPRQSHATKIATPQLTDLWQRHLYPYMELSCQPILVASRRVREAFVRLLVLSPSSVLSEEWPDRLLCHCVASLLANPVPLAKKRRSKARSNYSDSSDSTSDSSDDSSDSDSDNSDDEGITNPQNEALEHHVWLAVHVQEVIATWSLAVFVRQTDYRLQRHVTNFLLSGMSFLQLHHTEFDAFGETGASKDGTPMSELVSGLLEGVTVRLESSIPAIRKDGMMVAERLAQKMGQELQFDELEQERSMEDEDEVTFLQSVMTATEYPTHCYGSKKNPTLQPQATPVPPPLPSQSNQNPPGLLQQRREQQQLLLQQQQQQMQEKQRKQNKKEERKKEKEERRKRRKAKREGKSETRILDAIYSNAKTISKPGAKHRSMRDSYEDSHTEDCGGHDDTDVHYEPVSAPQHKQAGTSFHTSRQGAKHRPIRDSYEDSYTEDCGDHGNNHVHYEPARTPQQNQAAQNSLQMPSLQQDTPTNLNRSKNHRNPNYSYNNSASPNLHRNDSRTGGSRMNKPKSHYDSYDNSTAQESDYNEHKSSGLNMPSHNLRRQETAQKQEERNLYANITLDDNLKEEKSKPKMLKERGGFLPPVSAYHEQGGHGGAFFPEKGLLLQEPAYDSKQEVIHVDESTYNRGDAHEEACGSRERDSENHVTWDNHDYVIPESGDVQQDFYWQNQKKQERRRKHYQQQQVVELQLRKQQQYHQQEKQQEKELEQKTTMKLAAQVSTQKPPLSPVKKLARFQQPAVSEQQHVKAPDSDEDSDDDDEDNGVAACWTHNDVEMVLENDPPRHSPLSPLPRYPASPIRSPQRKGPASPMRSPMRSPQRTIPVTKSSVIKSPVPRSTFGAKTDMVEEKDEQTSHDDCEGDVPSLIFAMVEGTGASDREQEHENESDEEPYARNNNNNNNNNNNKNNTVRKEVESRSENRATRQTNAYQTLGKPPLSPRSRGYQDQPNQNYRLKKKQPSFSSSETPNRKGSSLTSVRSRKHPQVDPAEIDARILAAAYDHESLPSSTSAPSLSVYSSGSSDYSLSLPGDQDRNEASQRATRPPKAYSNAYEHIKKRHQQQRRNQNEAPNYLSPVLANGRTPNASDKRVKLVDPDAAYVSDDDYDDYDEEDYYDGDEDEEVSATYDDEEGEYTDEVSYSEDVDYEDEDSVWDESDRHLDAYDVEDDEEDLRETQRPRYLRDCLQLLRAPETDRQAFSKHKAALEWLPQILQDDDKPSDLQDLAVPLALELMRMENKFNLESFEDDKLLCVIALAVEEPLAVGQRLILLMWEDIAFMDRLDVLTVLSEAAFELSGNKELEEFQKNAASKQRTSDSGTYGKRAYIKENYSLLSCKDNSTMTGTDMGSIVSVHAERALGHVESKTRRWGRGRRPKEVLTVRSRFGPVANVWYYSLVGGFMQRKDNAALWGGAVGARLLANLFVTLATIVECAGYAPGTDVLAQDLFELVWSFRTVDVAEVRMGVLVAVAAALSCLTEEVVLTMMFDGSLSSLPEGLKQMAQLDPDVNCRRLAQSMSKQISSMVDSLQPVGKISKLSLSL